MQQLLARQNEEEYDLIEETSEEEELASNISGLDENLSDESFEAPLIYALNKSYSSDDIVSLEGLSNQQQLIINEYLLISRFENPVTINMDESESYQETLSNLILNSQSYTYWGKDTATNTLIFFQTMEYPIFYNKNALLLIQLNDDGEMVQYIQTMLEEEDDETEDPETLNSQMNAVSTLYHKEDALETGDEVTDVNLGYHNLTSLPNGEQVLNPTWNVKVNESENYFINAIEGHNYPQNDNFIETTYQDFLIELQNIEESTFNFLQTEEEEEETVLYETIEQNLINRANVTTIGVESE